MITLNQSYTYEETPPQSAGIRNAVSESTITKSGESHDERPIPMLRVGLGTGYADPDSRYPWKRIHQSGTSD